MIKQTRQTTDMVEHRINYWHEFHWTEIVWHVRKRTLKKFLLLCDAVSIATFM